MRKRFKGIRHTVLNLSSYKLTLEFSLVCKKKLLTLCVGFVSSSSDEDDSSDELSVFTGLRVWILAVSISKT